MFISGVLVCDPCVRVSVQLASLANGLYKLNQSSSIRPEDAN